MEMLVMAGGVQPQSQPHQKADCSADHKSEGQAPQEILDSPIFTRRVAELNPHPAYVRHHLAVSALKLSALSEQGDLVFREPLTITKGGTIIDGYARWELARHQGRSTLPCLEYGVSEEEALEWILRTHQRSSGLNSFNRIMLALDLEPSFQKQARSNQRAGGQYKGSSNLTEADKLDVRSEIAAAAGASVGNVSKVKRLRAAAYFELLEALRGGEISIHRAWKWCQAPAVEQCEALWQYRTERGIKKTIRELVSRHRSKNTPTPPDLANLVTRLAALRQNQLNSVKVGVIKNAGKAIYLTEELALTLDFQQMTLCEASNR
jgi:hypothetical protein